MAGMIWIVGTLVVWPFVARAVWRATYEPALDDHGDLLTAVAIGAVASLAWPLLPLAWAVGTWLRTQPRH